MTPEQFVFWVHGFVAGGQVPNVALLIEATNEAVARLKAKPITPPPLPPAPVPNQSIFETVRKWHDHPKLMTAEGFMESPR